MKTKLTLLLAITLIACASAQNSKKTYGEQFARLQKAYAKAPDDVETLFNLSVFYSDTLNPMSNLPSAMQHIEKAEKNQIDLLDRDKIGELTRLARKNITLGTIRTQKQTVKDIAYKTLESNVDMSDIEMESYMNAFHLDASMVRMLRQRMLNKVMQKDIATGTPESYYHFINIYRGTAEAEKMEALLAKEAPAMFDGQHDTTAIDSIVAAYKYSPSVARAANKQKARLAYIEAARKNTVEAYRTFMKAYPTSKEYLDARSRLEKLMTTDFNALDSPQQLASFAEANSDNELGEKAAARLREMAIKEHNIEAARLYLKHCRHDERYNDVFLTYYNWHTAEGNSDPILKFKQENSDFPYTIAIENDIEKAQKLDAINLTESYLEVEFSKYADYIRRTSGKGLALVVMQRMIQGLVATGRYSTAVERMDRFALCFDGETLKRYNELKQLLQRPATGRKPVAQFSAQYNIMHPTYNPADGMLYFTRENGSSKRICYAKRVNGQWQSNGIVEFENATNEGLEIYSFYDGGQRMILGSGGNIWMAEREGNSWRVTDIPPYPVNTDYREADACFLPDGTGLLLVSDRPGGMNFQNSGAYFHGDTAMASDIYFIPYTQFGWGEAVNLGPTVNTSFSERSPIMSRNLKTLYFISDGHGGLGYGDIYMTERKNMGSWTEWSTPVNLGKDINSGYPETSISFAPDEQGLYMSSRGALDVQACYTVATTHDATNPYESLQVEVLGMGDYLMRVRVADLEQQAIIQSINYQGDGHYVDIQLHRGKSYALLADAGIYFVPAVKVTSTNKKAPMLKGYTFPVLTSSDRVVPLDVVTFDPNTAQLRPIAMTQLEQLATFINNQTDGKVEFLIDVGGRDDTQCYTLSLERGRAIQNFMIANGVPADRIIISANGNVNLKKSKSESVSVKFRE